MSKLHAALLVALLALAPVLAGCVAASDSSVRVTPYVAHVRAEPGRPTDVAVFVENTGAFREEMSVRVDGMPANWSFAAENNGSLTLNGRATGAVVVSVTPDANATYGAHFVRVAVGGGSAQVVVEVADLGSEPARAGVGVQVFTVGFWDNGTVFYTNMKGVRDNPRLPQPWLDEEARSDEAMQALKVYLGGERGERPPEPYNSSGYVPVIDGFDERIRTGNGGMRAGETLAVRIPPEEAYTRPGNEDHALYGDALSFVIHVVSVDVLETDCLAPGTAACDVPPVPPVPPVPRAAPVLPPLR